MFVTYQQRIRESGQTIMRHQGRRRYGRWRCASGCGHWPCESLLLAVSELSRVALALDHLRGG